MIIIEANAHANEIPDRFKIRCQKKRNISYFEILNIRNAYYSYLYSRNNYKCKLTLYTRFTIHFERFFLNFALKFD